MSGKFEKKKTRRKSHKLLWIFLMAVIIALAVLLTMALGGKETQQPTGTGPTDAADAGTAQTDGWTEADTGTEVDVAVTQPGERQLFTVDEDIRILEVGRYAGYYMEDGSDEIVSDVTRITVTNEGEKSVQYAKLILTGPAGDAVFELTTLLPGQTMVVLEANRKSYTAGDIYEDIRVENLAYFQYEPSLREDQLQIQPMDGGFNIKNISSQDIAGKIMIYFKDCVGGVYYGGITYCGTIEGGIKAGEIKQVMSRNFTADSTVVVFINIME
jgi:hypothetical protein